MNVTMKAAWILSFLLLIISDKLEAQTTPNLPCPEFPEIQDIFPFDKEHPHTYVYETDICGLDEYNTASLEAVFKYF